MKSAISRVFVLLLVLLSAGVTTSCDKDNDNAETKSLIGSVWIYKFPENKIPNYNYTDIKVRALALVFGKNNKVDQYYLGEDFKIISLQETLNYKIKGDVIRIGIREGSYSGNSLYFYRGYYYRTKLAMSDLAL